MSGFRWCIEFQIGWSMNSGKTTFEGWWSFHVGKLYFLFKKRRQMQQQGNSGVKKNNEKI